MLPYSTRHSYRRRQGVAVKPNGGSATRNSPIDVCLLWIPGTCRCNANGLDAWLENEEVQCAGHVGMGMKLLEQKWRKEDEEWRKGRWFSCAECTCG